jgi:hypothetical protein
MSGNAQDGSKQVFEFKEESLEDLLRIGLARENSDYQPPLARAYQTQENWQIYQPPATLQQVERSTTTTKIHHTQQYKVRFETPVIVDQHGRQTRASTPSLQIHENEYERFEQKDNATGSPTRSTDKNKGR